MTESFIYVKPSADPNKVKVLTELLGELEIPVYIGAHSDGTLIDEDNPQPITDSLVLAVMKALNSGIAELLSEQKLTNLYLSKVVGEDLRNDNELENRI